MNSARTVLCVSLVLWASGAQGQTPAAVPAGTDASPAAAPAATRVVDVHTVDPHSYRATAMRVPIGLTPVIDGRLDDTIWTLAPVFGDFIQREPEVGAPSTEVTEFRVSYDDRNLYIAIWAYETDPVGSY